MLFQHFILHHVELSVLLHHEQLVVLLVDLAQLEIQLMLAPPAHIFVELRHLPHGVPVHTLSRNKAVHLLQLGQALLQIFLQDAHLLLLLHVFHLVGFELGLKILGHLLLCLE